MEEKKNEEVKKEGEVFAPLPTKIKTLKGDELVIPKITLRKEIQIFKLWGEGLKQNAKLQEIDWTQASMEALLNAIPDALCTLPDVLCKMTALILGREEAFIMDNFDSLTLLEVVKPFFGRYSKVIPVEITKNVQENTKISTLPPLSQN